MAEDDQTGTTFVSLHTAALTAGVPRSWLQRQAEAGELPALRIGRRWYFNIDVLNAHLFERAGISCDDVMRHVDAAQPGQGGPTCET